MDIINRNIKYIRVHHRLTQSEFADKLETSRDNISKYESKSIPRPDILRKISEIFNINIHSMFFTEMNDANYHLFQLGQDTLTTDITAKSDYKDFDRITAKDVKQFESILQDKVRLLSRDDLNEVDKKIILADLLKYQDILIRKLIEFYDKQSQLFDYLSEKGILPK